MSILPLRGIRSEIAPEAVTTGREDSALSACPGILRAAEDRGVAIESTNDSKQIVHRACKGLGSIALCTHREDGVALDGSRVK
jgi:hypothetical protein